MSTAEFMGRLAQDDAARTRALEMRSFIVEAPAGAGKTELLTQRYLRLLATVDTPEEIVAITFTNKAAGEMRERIAQSLALARSEEAPAAAHKRVTYALARAALARAEQRGWQLEAQPGRLRLTTIDALCASLARQMPYLSRFGSQPAVADSAMPHYEEAARRALEHLEAGDELAESVAIALRHVDNDGERLVRLVAQMLARREQWHQLAALERPEAAIGEVLRRMVAGELQAIAQALPPAWQERLMPLARHAFDNLGGGALSQWTQPLGAAVEDLPSWRALAGWLLTSEDTLRKTITVRDGFPKEDKLRKAAMLACLGEMDVGQVAALRRVRQLPLLAEHAADEAAQAGLVRALVRLLKLAAAQLWLVFAERCEVDFSELAARAAAALGDEAAPSELALRLDYRIRHLLVDEFQDTSPAQVELLARLTAGWQPDDGRTLFVVGDPMQSIYRFRKADVGLFLRLAQDAQVMLGLPLEALRLTRNNRSAPAVVDWINQRFAQILPLADEALRGEIAYRPCVATRDGDAWSAVCVHPLIADAEAGADALAKAEAQALLRLIAAERAAAADAGLPPPSIAVLVRAKDHLAALVAALRRAAAEGAHGLAGEAWRFRAVDIEPLAQRQVVQDLIALTRALHHRGDRLHWLAVLRAPWCGLSLADLAALAEDDHHATLWTLMHAEERVGRLSADGAARLRHVRAVLGEALAGQGRQSRRRWVEDAWRKLGGPLAAGAEGAADAQAFFARLGEIDAAGRFVLDRLEADMGRLFAPPDARADERLQLMSIHKAKGLEFDVVILPGLHHAVVDRDTPLLAWDSFALEDGEHLAAAALNARRREREAPSAYDFIQRLERERGANEEARILYVGVTRARQRLHLVGGAWRDTDGGLREPRAGSPLKRLWPVLGAEFVAANGMLVTPVAASASVPYGEFLPWLERLAAPAAPAAWQAPPDAASVSLAAPEEPPPALAAAVGRLVHAVLEQIAQAPAAWPPERPARSLPAFAAWLAGQGWSEAEGQEGARRAAHMLSLTLASPDGQWALRQRPGAAAELALSQRIKLGAGEAAPERLETLTRVVDRSFVEDGVRWIIDWKTSAVGEIGAAVDEAALAAHAERYREQLQAYADLFVEAAPRDQDDQGAEARAPALQLAVFYVAHGRLIRLHYNRRSE